MTDDIASAHAATHSHALFGFWVYLMTDCVLFATLFATYAVLHTGTYGGPSSATLFSLPFALTETLILLTSSFASGLSFWAARHGRRAWTLFWLACAFFLGAAFVTMELHEFSNFVHEGNSWQRSAFLSAFFTLVGTHGLHVTLGLFWMVVLLPSLCRRALSATAMRRFSCLTLFWHFLDIIWIFIFTLVYLLGTPLLGAPA